MLSFIKKLLDKRNKDKIYNLLLAEDNQVSRMITTSVLERMGFLVDTVENGSLALQAIRVKKYDLVLMDVHMPVMNGYEATQCIDNLIRERVIEGLPVVALTADTAEEERARCIALGMTDYIAKPIRRDELTSIVSKHLQGNKRKKLKAA